MSIQLGYKSSAIPCFLSLKHFLALMWEGMLSSPDIMSEPKTLAVLLA